MNNFLNLEYPSTALTPFTVLKIALLVEMIFYYIPQLYTYNV